jgi:hypothetical protein
MNTIENDSQGSKARSPVIDLEAEDISPAADTGETEPPKEEPVSSPPPERTPFWTRNRITGIAAILAALFGAWLYREFGADFWPPTSVSALEARLGTVEASNRTLNQQLNSLGGTTDAVKAETAKLAETTASKEQDLEARVAEMDKALGELRQSITGLGSSPAGSADPAALAGLTQRVDRLEQAVASLREGGGTPPTTTTEGQDFSQLSQALADLRAKFSAGVPYKEELDRIAVYVPQNPDLADLQASASSGIASAAALGSALEALVPSLSGPGASDADTADAGGFWAWVGTVVKVRDLNTLDWADLARAAAADAKAGDLKAAIARIEETGGDPPPQVAEWRDRARQRLKAEGALVQLAAAVTAVIAGNP